MKLLYFGLTYVGWLQFLGLIHMCGLRVESQIGIATIKDTNGREIQNTVEISGVNILAGLPAVCPKNILLPVSLHLRQLSLIDFKNCF